MRIERVINKVWRGLGDRRPAFLILVLLFIIQVIAFTLPQIPVPSGETAVFNRWLAEFRTVLGDQTRLLASLGLLTIRSSYLQRLTLSLLSLIVVANIDRLWAVTSTPDEANADSSVDKPQTNADRKPRQVGRLLLILGGLLIIVGWAGQMLWGWREPRVTAWPESSINLSDRGLTVSQPEGPIGIWNEKYGLYVIPRGQQSGFEVRVFGEDGSQIPLLPSVGEEPKETLQLTLARQEPEAYFAVPDAELIFRLNRFDDLVEVQAYRSASGELLAETQLREENPQTVLAVNEVDVEFTTVLLPQYEVIYNPTAVIEALGFPLFAGGTIALMIAPSLKTDESLKPSSEKEEA